MVKIERFEDLISWQKAHELNRLVYKISANGTFAKDFGLRDQIRRASISIMSNIAEGFESGGDKEFAQFLSNAKGSCGLNGLQALHEPCCTRKTRPTPSARSMRARWRGQATMRLNPDQPYGLR